MARKKNNQEQELRPVAAATGVEKSAEKSAEVTPSVVEYQPLTTSEKWRVARWDLFLAEMDRAVEVKDLPGVHAVLREYPRSWMVARRLYGFMPVVVDLRGDPEDYRVWGKEELAAELEIGLGELNAEVMAVRGLLTRNSGQEKERVVSGPDYESKASPVAALMVTDEELLRQFGYSPAMFELLVRSTPSAAPAPRSKVDNEAERRWFVGRVRQFEKVLKDAMAGRVADQVLRNELRLKRVEDQLMVAEVGSAEYDRLMKGKQELEQTYERQVEKLKELAPWANTSEKQMAAKDAFSEVVRAYQEYYGNGDAKLIDGLFTAYELQVLVRSSVQKPEPEYRLGWVMYVNDSRNWLWDPHAQSRFRPRDLAKFDAGFKAGVKAYVEENGEQVPDLMREGPEGEYEDIFVAPEGEEK